MPNAPTLPRQPLVRRGGDSLPRQGGEGAPHPDYGPLLQELTSRPPAELRTLEEHIAATLREMGVSSDAVRTDGLPWRCDLLPHLFTSADWEQIVRGFRQRLRAFECFLEDVYGRKEILRANVLPLPAVLGSRHYQHACAGLPRPRGSFLHLCGLCLARNSRGGLQVTEHHFSHAPGLSFMMQNRRALARVLPELLDATPAHSLAEMPLLVLEQLRAAAADTGGRPAVVLLSAGVQGAGVAEQSFLARRMGIPIVQGGDLLVLDDRVHLKTVRGLERVDVIYTRLADEWLDPLVFRKDSMHGVPGLVHCMRKGTVALVNAVGSQLADDRGLLAFSSQIIRYYLSENPILPTAKTLWLGDLDQRELVLENLGAWRVMPAVRQESPDAWTSALNLDEAALRTEIRREASRFVAQPVEAQASTFCIENGRLVESACDHIVFAVRTGGEFDVIPGALTRVHPRDPAITSHTTRTSKDTWVLSDELTEQLRPRPLRGRAETHVPARPVTSRVAEAFYWMGRYLERAHHQAYLISVIATLETEELNPAERKLYRPMWNRLLPPLDRGARSSRRSIANHIDRYHLLALPEPGSVVSTFERALRNAESVQDSLSPEAWVTLNHLRTRFQRSPFRKELPEAEAVSVSRRLSDLVTQLIAQFFGVAANTMLADDGWRFCEIGQMLERAIITANSVHSIGSAFAPEKSERALSPHGLEIQLSAFLRLLGTRDAFRRIYQMRAAPLHVLEMLWQHPQVPRSVVRCLSQCEALLRESIDPETSGALNAPEAINELVHRINRVDWAEFVAPRQHEDLVAATSPPARSGARSGELDRELSTLLDETLAMHAVIADGFLNHQAWIARAMQPPLL